MVIKFHHNACSPKTETGSKQTAYQQQIDLSEQYCILGVLTWGSSQTNCIELVLAAFRGTSRFVKLFESEPVFSDNKTKIHYSCYVDQVRKIAILFLDGNQASCDSRSSAKHEMLIAYATIFSVCHLVINVQLSTRLDSTFEVMYRRIDRLRRSFTPLVKLLSRKLFLQQKVKNLGKNNAKNDAETERSTPKKGDEPEKCTTQSSDRTSQNRASGNRGVSESQRSQDSQLLSQDGESLFGENTMERRTQATDSEDETSDYEGSFNSESEIESENTQNTQDWAIEEDVNDVLNSQDDNSQEFENDGYQENAGNGEDVENAGNGENLENASEFEHENEDFSKSQSSRHSNNRNLSSANLPIEILNWSDHGRLVSPRLMFFVDVNYYDWKNINNPRAILEQLENAETTFEQRVQTLAKKSRLYTGQTPVGLFTLSSPKGNGSRATRYAYFNHAQTSHLRDFYTEYLQPHVDLVHSKKGFKDALARNGQFWTAMPVATPILENWLKMTCSVISSLQSKSQLRCNKLLKVVTDIQNMAANICDIEAKFTRSRSERVIPQAMQRFTELLEIKKEKMTRENQKKYIEDAKKFVQTKIPQGPDCQRAQFIIERAISQQYIQRAETVVTWSSCGRQTAVRPIDEACNPEDLMVFFRGLNASVQPQIEYRELGNGFTLCKLGDSSEFNLSSNTGLKVTNQTGFISAGNYLVPWHFDDKGKQQAKLLNIPGQRYRRSAKWGDILYVGFEYETQNELRFFGYTPKTPVIKSRDGEISETGQELLENDRELFLCLGKNGTERDQTGQLTRLWFVVPENYKTKISPTISIGSSLITTEPKTITLGEGTYCVHLPVLFPQVKTTTGLPIPKSKIVKAALEWKIAAVFKANVLGVPEKLDEEQGDIYE